MNNRYFIILTLPMILTDFNSSSAADSYAEPPQLYKEIELRHQSEAKRAEEEKTRIVEEQRIIEEQAARAEKEKQIAKKKEKEQALRDAQEKKINEERQKEKMAREEEEKRVAQEKAAIEQEEKRISDIKSAVAERIRQERLVKERAYRNSSGNSDMEVAQNFVSNLPPACSSSRIYTSIDGTVNINIICIAPGNSMDGLISIKNGVITNVR